MKINSVNCLQGKTAFKSNYAKLKENTKNKSFVSDNSKKIIAAMAGMAVIGAAFTCYYKKNNIQTGGLFSRLKDKFSGHSAADPIVKKLNGKRDAEAVKLYNAYKSKDKLESLRKKVINGEFDKKPSEVFQHLTENSKKLERAAQFAV